MLKVYLKKWVINIKWTPSSRLPLAVIKKLKCLLVYQIFDGHYREVN